METLGENFKVRLRGGFSERNKISVENQEMQYKSLDDRTRTMLVNMTNIVLGEIYINNWQKFYMSVIADVYALEIDFTSRCDVNVVKTMMLNTIRQNTYDEVLTLIEYIVKRISQMEPWRDEGFGEHYNVVFKNEYVGYRFVNDIIVSITDENEINAINESASSPFEVVNTHISKAIHLLSDREKPDYENSIKESISAVEALCELYTGVKGKEASLGKMLKKIEDEGIVIHSAMKSAFNTLYGYTSDAKGIRHAGDIGGPSSTFEEAKFMLVSCSAFINYLIGISTK